MNRLLLAALLMPTLGTLAMAETCPGNPDALGTSRSIEVSTKHDLRIGQKTYPQTLALEKGEVVLTFDDGPLPATTRTVLDALAHECVKATFFLVGRNSKASPDLVKRELREGHTVGHHSFSHPAVTMAGLSDSAARADIERGFQADDMAAYGSAGSEPRVPFFRYPGFADTPELNAWLNGRGIGIFGADLWASDWVEMTPEKTLEVLMTRLRHQGKGIVLLHDTRHQTAAMVARLLRQLKAEGFRIVHMVPAQGDTTTPLDTAPAGWTSETEAIIRKNWPAILAIKKREEQKPGQPRASSAAGAEKVN